MRTVALLSLSGIALLLSACSTTGTSSSVPHVSELLSESTGQNGRACVRTHRIRGYGVLENNIISIDASRKYYLATVFPGCTSLDTSFKAAFEGNFGEVCGGSMDQIHSGGDNCSIRSMYEFEDRKEAFAAYDAAIAKRNELREALKESKSKNANQ